MAGPMIPRRSPYEVIAVDQGGNVLADWAFDRPGRREALSRRP